MSDCDEGVGARPSLHCDRGSRLRPQLGASCCLELRGFGAMSAAAGGMLLESTASSGVCGVPMEFARCAQFVDCSVTFWGILAGRLRGDLLCFLLRIWLPVYMVGSTWHWSVSVACHVCAHRHTLNAAPSPCNERLVRLGRM